MTPGEGAEAFGGLQAVAAKEAEGERPMEEAIHQQGEEEGADVLPVGEPDGGVGIAARRIAAFEGENVDEDGAGADEEDVERGGVLEDPAGGDGLVAEVEGEVGGGEPLRRGPLPRVGGDGDSGMAEDELRAGVVDCGGDEVSALLHGLAEGRLEKVEHFGARGGGDEAHGQFAFKAERACGIAECGAGRRFSHATSRDSADSVATGGTSTGAVCLLAKKARIRRRMK